MEKQNDGVADPSDKDKYPAVDLRIEERHGRGFGLNPLEQARDEPEARSIAGVCLAVRSPGPPSAERSRASDCAV